MAADATVLALGGASWPRLGSTGDWAELLAEKGVAVVAAACRPIAAFSSIGRTRSAAASRASRSSASRCRSAAPAFAARRWSRHGGIEGGAVYALSARLREAIASRGNGGDDASTCAPTCRSLDLAARLAQAARQAIAVDVPAQGGKPCRLSRSGCCTRRRTRASPSLSPMALAALVEGGAAAAHRRCAHRNRHLDGRRRRLGRRRRASHAASPARRLRRRRDARLGSADRWLSAAGVPGDRRAWRPAAHSNGSTAIDRQLSGASCSPRGRGSAWRW